MTRRDRKNTVIALPQLHFPTRQSVVIDTLPYGEVLRRKSDCVKRRRGALRLHNDRAPTAPENGGAPPLATRQMLAPLRASPREAVDSPLHRGVFLAEELRHLPAGVAGRQRQAMESTAIAAFPASADPVPDGDPCHLGVFYVQPAHRSSLADKAPPFVANIPLRMSRGARLVPGRHERRCPQRYDIGRELFG